MSDLIATIRQRRKSELSPLRRWLRGKKPLRKHSVAEISEAERRSGLSFPEDFSAFYREIGSGEFGPGYGSLPLLPPNDPIETNVIDRYLLFQNGDPDEPEFYWPEGLLQFCHWGCAIWSCIDCSSGKIFRADPNFGTNYVIGVEADSFDSFIRRWLDDELPFELESIRIAAAQKYPDR